MRKEETKGTVVCFKTCCCLTVQCICCHYLCNLAHLVGEQIKQFSYAPSNSSPHLPLFFASVNQFLFFLICYYDFQNFFCA